MKQTFLDTALANMCGALALTLMVGAGTALADDNDASADGDQIAVQSSLNGNGSGNAFDSGNDNDQLDLDVSESGNGSFNGNGSGNTLGSNNDDDGVDLDLVAEDALNDKSTNTAELTFESSNDRSITIGDITSVVSEQYLLGAAAAVNMSTEHGDITTGGVEYGEGANTMAAGNMTESANTGAGSVALSSSTIQAKGNFHIGN